MISAPEKRTCSPLLTESMEELGEIKGIGLPVAALNLVGYLRSMISVVCMGKLGALELAGGAMAIGFTNITGYSVLSGLAMGMDPLCSQGLGSRNLALVVSSMQRTVIMLLTASVPIALLWLKLESIMRWLGQDPAISAAAALYCRFALPDLVANSFLHPLRVYLRNKAELQPLLWCTSLAVLLLHWPLTALLSTTLGLGVAGVAIATVCTNFATLLFLLAYMLCTRGSSAGRELPARSAALAQPLAAPFASTATAPGKSWAALVRLALPSCLGVCLEWWWYELMTLAAGYLRHPSATLGAAAIVIQTTSVLYMLPATLSSAASARVGNELGAGRPGRARVAALTAMGLAVAASSLGLLGTTVGRYHWVRLFTSDGEVIRLTEAVLPIIGLCELANSPQTAGCGILRGSARPSVGAAINFYSFYLVGAPLAFILAFPLGKGFTGLCHGLLAAQVTCALSILTVLYRTDWEDEAAKAKDLVGGQEGDLEDVLCIHEKGRVDQRLGP